MTTEAALTLQGDPYEGLHDMARLCLDRLRVRIETVRPWHTLKPIMGGGPGIFDDIANFLRTLLGYLDPYWLWQKLKWWALDPIMNWLHDHILNPFLTNLWAIKDSFLGWWGGALNGLINAIHGIPNLIRDAITNLPAALWNILTNVFNTLKAGISYDLWLLGVIWDKIPASIRDPITAFANMIFSRIQTLWEVFGGYFNNLKTGVIATIDNLRLFLHNPLEGLRQIWGRFEQTWAGQLLAQIVTSLGAFVNMIITKLKELWARIQPIIIEVAERALATARPLVERWWGEFKSLPATYLNWVAMSAGTDLAMQPSRSLGTVGSLYGICLAAGSIAHITSTILNVIPTTSWVGAAQLAAYINEVAGFEQITRASYGVLLNEVLAMPLRYHWNMLLRPKLPTEGEIFIMGRKHGITEGEFKQAMAYMGLPDWWIGKMYDFFWTDPSPMWLLRMTEGGIPRLIDPKGKREWLDQWLPGWQNDPYAWLKMKLMLAGYEDVDIEPMISGMKTRALASPLTQFKTSVRAMLREAYWTKEDAAGTLSPWNVRTEEIELLYRAEELDYQKRYLDGEVDFYAERFRKGEIDDQDLGLALSTMIVKPERVAQIVARERVRALPKPKAITEPKEDPLVTSLRKQATDSWIKQYRDWKIEEADLLLGLTIVLQDKDLAAKMVAVEKTRYRPPPAPPVPPKEDPIVAQSRRQAIATWITGFRNGEFGSEQLELYLEPLIPDKDTRTQLVNLEMLRYKPTPELIPVVSEDPSLAKIRQEYVAGHCEMFQKRLIGLEQLYAFLLADGLVEALARSTVITQATKRIKIPRLDSPYFLSDTLQALVEEGLEAYDQMYMEGTITIDQYIAWLTTMAADPEVITYLADTITLRRFLERL